MKPLISIVVPVYNIAPYLSRCLDSILKQTYDNLEVIIVDDGSEDESGIIANEYVDKNPDKIRCFHTENSGVTNARLKGLSEAKGVWVGFVDGDDEIEPDMYERLIHNAQAYNTDISHCGYQTIVNEGERVHYFYNTGYLIYQDNLTGLRDLLSGTFVEPSLCNKIYRKSLFHDNMNRDMIDCNVKHNEDLLMNYMLFSRADSAVYEDFCPYHYMARDNSATRTPFNKNKAYDPIKVWRYIVEHGSLEVRNIAKKGYLKAYINAYGILCQSKQMKMETRKIRESIICLKEDWKLLDRNNQIRARLIRWIPMFYKGMEKIYTTYIQRKIYE